MDNLILWINSKLHDVTWKNKSKTNDPIKITYVREKAMYRKAYDPQTPPHTPMSFPSPYCIFFSHCFSPRRVTSSSSSSSSLPIVGQFDTYIGAVRKKKHHCNVSSVKTPHRSQSPSFLLHHFS